MIPLKKLVSVVTDNVFEDGLDENLLKEYYERNERKKKDEAWLKKYSQIIKAAMEKQGKSKTVVGNIKVSISVPDTSHFDMDKVLEYLQNGNVPSAVFERVTKTVVDEDALTAAVEEGIINLEELKAHAWVESHGTPRLTVSIIGDKSE